VRALMNAERKNEDYRIEYALINRLLQTYSPALETQVAWWSEEKRDAGPKGITRSRKKLVVVRSAPTGRKDSVGALPRIALRSSGLFSSPPSGRMRDLTGWAGITISSTEFVHALPAGTK